MLAWKRVRETPGSRADAGTRRDIGARELRVCIIIQWSCCNMENPLSLRLQQAVSDKNRPARETRVWH